MKQKAYSVCLVQLCFCFDCRSAITMSWINLLQDWGRVMANRHFEQLYERNDQGKEQNSKSRLPKRDLLTCFASLFSDFILKMAPRQIERE